MRVWKREFRNWVGIAAVGGQWWAEIDWGSFNN